MVLVKRKKPASLVLLTIVPTRSKPHHHRHPTSGITAQLCVLTQNAWISLANQQGWISGKTQYTNCLICTAGTFMHYIPFSTCRPWRSFFQPSSSVTRRQTQEVDLHRHSSLSMEKALTGRTSGNARNLTWGPRIKPDRLVKHRACQMNGRCQLQSRIWSWPLVVCVNGKE